VYDGLPSRRREFCFACIQFSHRSSTSRAYWLYLMFIIQPTSIEVEEGWEHRDGLYIDGMKEVFGGWIHCFAKQEKDEFTKVLLS